MELPLEMFFLNASADAKPCFLKPSAGVCGFESVFVELLSSTTPGTRTTSTTIPGAGVCVRASHAVRAHAHETHDKEATILSPHVFPKMFLVTKVFF